MHPKNNDMTFILSHVLFLFIRLSKKNFKKTGCCDKIYTVR